MYVAGYYLTATPVCQVTLVFFLAYTRGPISKLHAGINSIPKQREKFMLKWMGLQGSRERQSK